MMEVLFIDVNSHPKGSCLHGTILYFQLSLDGYSAEALIKQNPNLVLSFFVGHKNSGCGGVQGLTLLYILYSFCKLLVCQIVVLSCNRDKTLSFQPPFNRIALLFFCNAHCFLFIDVSHCPTFKDFSHLSFAIFGQPLVFH